MPTVSLFRIRTLLARFAPSLIALGLTFLAGVIFAVFGFPGILARVSTGLPPRTVTLFLLALYALLTLAISYFGRWSKRRGLSMWCQSNLLLIYTLVYYLRLNAPSFAIDRFVLNRAYAFVPLLILIFLVNRNLYALAKKRTYLLVAEILLICVSTFSLLNVIETIPGAFLSFAYQFLFEFFNLPTLFWVTLSSLIIALLSVLNLRLNRYREVLLFTGLSSSLFAGFFYVLNALNFSYWYQALLFLILWDFVYHLLIPIIHHEGEYNYLPKLTISLAYHLALFVLVFSFQAYA